MGFFHGATKFEGQRLAHVTGSILVLQVKDSSLGMCHCLLCQKRKDVSTEWTESGAQECAGNAGYAVEIP